MRQYHLYILLNTETYKAIHVHTKYWIILSLVVPELLFLQEPIISFIIYSFVQEQPLFMGLIVKPVDKILLFHILE